MLYRLYLNVVDYDVFANTYYFKPYKMETNEFSGMVYRVNKCDLLNFVEYLLYDLSKSTKAKKVSISFVDDLIDVGASDKHLWDGSENIVFTLNKKKDKVSTYISSICWKRDKVRKLHFMDTDTLALMLNLLIGTESSLISNYDKETWDSVFSEEEDNIPSVLDGVDVPSMTDGEFLYYLSKNYVSDEILDDNVDNKEIDDDGDLFLNKFEEDIKDEDSNDEDNESDIIVTGPDDKVDDKVEDNESVGGQINDSVSISPVTYHKTNLKGLDLSGKLISFEGGEGSGKTSQINRLAWDLEQNGYDVLSLREPGGSKIAEEIREIILKKENKDMCTRCESLCFAAARAQLMEEIIEPALKDGKVVILDRYVDSSYVYQGLVKEAGLDNIELINDFATNRKIADLTIYIDVSPEEGFRRIELNNRETNKFEEVDISFHEMVRENYKSLAKKYSNRIVELDGEKSMNAVYKSITNVLKSKFKPLN